MAGYKFALSDLFQTNLNLAWLRAMKHSKKILPEIYSIFKYFVRTKVDQEVNGTPVFNIKKIGQVVQALQ